MVIGPQLIFNQIFGFENIGFFVTRAASNLKMLDTIHVNQNKNQVPALKKIETTLNFFNVTINVLLMDRLRADSCTVTTIKIIR